MKYSSYFEKTARKEAQNPDNMTDPARERKTIKVKGSESITRIKEALQFADYKEKLSGSQILKYSVYESKLQAYLSQALIFGVAFAIFRRISFAKLDWNYKLFHNLCIDLVVPVTYMNYLAIFEYPNLYLDISDQSEIENMKRVSENQAYEREKMQGEAAYRKKFYTNAQYWH